MIFEDEHLLAVNKPPGWNIHAPSPHAGEGIYDWLKHREPRWASLAIVHRLDKETSGALVFGKTPLANRSLTEQFTARAVRKQYILLTDRPPGRSALVVKSRIRRAGDRYVSAARGEMAETRFYVRNPNVEIQPTGGGRPMAGCELGVEPLTGRTHQIRVHAAENGFPVLGDSLYGGRSFQRVCLHALSLAFRHPASGKRVEFEVRPEFDRRWDEALRASFIDRAETNAFRLAHGASDLTPGCYLDALGDYLLAQQERPLDAGTELPKGYRGTYFKLLARDVRSVNAASCPRHLYGEAAPDRFVIRENGVKFELSFREGGSVGLFLDQRDNRRRLRTGHLAAGFPLLGSQSQSPKFDLLNCFAYTCGFSVCAALAGARTTSVDLSRKYLEWGERNFGLNGLKAGGHEFLHGDVFGWLRRLAKRGRGFEVVLLDPPTFSQSREGGVFRVERDFGRLVRLALPVLRPAGVLFCSTNSAAWTAEKFLACVEAAIEASGRRILQRHYVPQPPDFPITRAEPAYLKTVWLRVA